MAAKYREKAVLQGTALELPFILSFAQCLTSVQVKLQLLRWRRREADVLLTSI